MFTTPWGSYSIDHYEPFTDRTPGGGCWRFDLYTPADDRPAVLEHVFATGRHDASRQTELADNDSHRCSTCWLGYAHTLDYHNASIATYESSKATWIAANPGRRWPYPWP